MARTGNYVTVPGGSMNWTAGLSNSLSDLSRSLISQADTEEERKRLAAETAKADKRYADARSREARLDAYQVGRDAVSDARYTKTAARQDVIQGREDEVHKLKQTQLAADKLISKFTNSYNFDTKYRKEDYAPEQAQLFDKVRTTIDNEKLATENFMRVGDDKALAVALGAFKDRLKTTNVNKATIDGLVADRKNNLLSFNDETSAYGIDGKNKDVRIATAIGGLYDNDYKRLEEGITSGRGITRREQVNKLISMLPESVRSAYSRDEIAQRLGSVVTANSRQDLIASEEARVAGLNDQAKSNAKGAETYYTLAAKGLKASGGGYVSRKPADILAAVKEVSGLDIGSMDGANAIMMTEKMLQNEEITPQAAVAAIHLGIDRGLMEKSISQSDFARIEENAIKFSNASKGSGGSSLKGMTLDTFTPKLNSSRGLSSLLLNRVNFLGGDRRTVPVTDAYNRRILDEAARSLDTKGFEGLVSGSRSSAETEPSSSRVSTLNTSNPSRLTRRGRRGSISYSAPEPAVEIAQNITALRNLMDKANRAYTNPDVPSFVRNKSGAEIKAYTNALREKTARLIELQNQKAAQQ